MGFVVQWVVEEEWGSRKIFKRSTPFISGRGGCIAANQLLSNYPKLLFTEIIDAAERAQKFDTVMS